MARKSFLDLSPEEKKKLRSKRISQRKLEEHTISEISEILDVSIERARRIVLGNTTWEIPLLGSSFSAIQKQIDASFNPLKGMGSFIAHLNRDIAPSTGTGMAEMVAHLNKQAVIGGSLSKSFQHSILLSKQYENLRIHDWVNKAAINGLGYPGLAEAIAQTSHIQSFTQKLLGSFAWKDLGTRINVNNLARELTQRKFLDLSNSYQNTLAGIVANPKTFEEFPVLAKMPSIEYRSHTALLELISSTETEDLTMEDLASETDVSITTNLPQLHTSYPKMWMGAKAALHSKNPDRIRHFSASVRELLTQIIHQLAPNEEVKKWSTNPVDFANGKPTRKARFSYICRELNTGSFSGFLAKDLSAMVGLFDLFQEGTHGVDPDFTDDQLAVIEFRVESYLRFLLEIEFKANK
jgi:hypothetical protein